MLVSVSMAEVGEWSLQSASRELTVDVRSDANKGLEYRVSTSSGPVVDWSPLGLVLSSQDSDLDHNRALAQLAAKTGTHANRIKRMTVWGNHSSTQYPDVSQALVNERAAKDLVSQDWITGDFIPTVQQRGAAIIKARGLSSAASAASAAIDHVRDWALGTPGDDWASMAVPADGSYGIKEGVIYSFPCRCAKGKNEIVQGLPVSDFSRARMDATDTELREERAAIADLLPR